MLDPRQLPLALPRGINGQHLSQLLARLIEADVEFVLVGGLAAAIHGLHPDAPRPAGHSARSPAGKGHFGKMPVVQALRCCYMPFMIASSDIERMSVEERLQAVELLWDSLSRQSGNVASPAWHGQVLAARRAMVEAGEGTFLSMAELRARLKPGV